MLTKGMFSTVESTSMRAGGCIRREAYAGSVVTVDAGAAFGGVTTTGVASGSGSLIIVELIMSFNMNASLNACMGRTFLHKAKYNVWTIL